MSKTEIIERTVIALRQLPEQKGEEVADFADFILSKIQELVSLIFDANT